MTLNTNDVLQHSPLVLYLLAVAGLSLHLLPKPKGLKGFSLLCAAAGSLGVTWTYMIRYMLQSYQDHRKAAGLLQKYTTTRWLQETSLFDEAWRYVCSTPERWWISNQLCLFTVGVFTVFLYAESSRHPSLRGKALRYMILGQIVAISFASSLFLAAIQGQASRSAAHPSQILRACIALAFITIVAVPFTVAGSSFLPNLLVMHVLLAIPLFQAPSSAAATPIQAKETCKAYARLYWAIAIASGALHIAYALPVLARGGWSLEAFGNTFWATIYSYPAQSSISWDVICTNGIWQFWSVCEVWRLSGFASKMEVIGAATCIGIVPTVGSASGIAAFLAIREGWLAKPRSKVQ